MSDHSPLLRPSAIRPGYSPCPYATHGVLTIQLIPDRIHERGGFSIYYNSEACQWLKKQKLWPETFKKTEQMAHNPITLDLLRALDAIDKRGSFAAAAQALHKVPSALTYTIQKVEQDLNLELFDRSGHRAKLTAPGKLLLDQGRLILRDIDSLAQSAQKVASGWEPELTICVDHLFDVASLFPLIREFNSQYAFVRINLRQGSLSGSWEQLLNGSADLLLAPSNTNPKIDGYDKKTLGEFLMTFAVSSDHPLATQANEVSEDMIDNYPVIVVPDSTQLMAPQTLGWTRRSQTISVDNMSEKIAAQKAGLGVGYLPQHRIRDELASGELVRLHLDDNSGTALAAWRQGEPGPALQWFIDRIDGAQLGI